MSEGPDAPLPSVEAVIGLTWSALSKTGPVSGNGDVAKTSEGLLVKVNRRRKMCPSVSGASASPGGSKGGVVDSSSIVLVDRWGVEGGREVLGGRVYS